ncbi:hypothetical protein [Halovivax cerinus]|uniref:ABC-type nitrate/sulfonate/bicarbonate transport system, periplasmic component n=1 Tax=Halovivax cerinus TaxID=1487865 RepID=A0ABD5NQC6_9EURY|nr:hypothetical protein [Halovivax cerinus]
MKSLGTIGAGGLATSLAGCMGGGSEGSSLNVVTAPTPTTSLEINHLQEETDIFETVMDDIGYEGDVQLTWDELSQFMGGQADIAPSVGTVEAAQLATERDFDLTAHAQTTPQHTALYVRSGSDYDPDVAGSKQAAIDALVENDAAFGIGGWGNGPVPAYRLIFQEKYGYSFEEGGDFNIVTGEFPALAQMVAEGNIDAGGSGPPYGLYPVRDQVKPLLWNQEELADIDLPKTAMCISNGITRTSYAEENTEAIAAWFGMEKYAHEYMANNVDELAARSDVQESLNVPNEDAAAWILNFRYNAMNTENELPASLQDVPFTEDRIAQDKESLRSIESMGQLSSGWEESLSYMEHDIDEYYEMAKNNA